MFDDLRKQASDDSSFEQEEEQQDVYSLKETKRRAAGDFLGMTAPQRFVIAVMLLLMTCILSSFCLLVTGRIVLPGF
jgi:hypothetical protein